MGCKSVPCSEDGTAKIWRAASPEEVARWRKQESDAIERLESGRSARAAAAERERLLRLQDPGTLQLWLVLSPLGFTNQNGAAALREEQLPDEAHLHPRVGETTGVGLAWRPIRPYDNLIDFDSVNRSHSILSVAYAVSYVESATELSDLSLFVGSQDMCKIYLNGQELYQRDQPGTFIRDRDMVTGVRLNKGLNVLVFKAVIQERIDGDWRGSVRLADAAGHPVKGIQATITPATDDDPGAMHQWTVLAPLRFEGTNGVLALNRAQLPDEAHLQPCVGTRHRAGGHEVVWQEFRALDYSLDFKALAGTTNTDYAVAYAVCYIQSETNQADLTMKVGSDDQAKIYVNAKEIYRYDGPGRALLPDQDKVTGVELKAGLNTVVFKVVNERGDWGGSLRFTDPGGRPVKGLRVTLDPGHLAQRSGQ